MKRLAKLKYLYAVSGLAGMLSVAVVAAAIAVPLELSPAAPDVPPLPKGASGPGPGESGNVDELNPGRLAQLVQRDLRRPLYDDAESDPAPAVAESRTPLTVRLIGIALEPDHSVAMLLRADGRIALAQAGETVELAGGSMKVLEVSENSVDVEFQGAQTTLQLPERTRSGDSQ